MYKVSKNKFEQVQEERRKTQINQSQKEIPLWKIHSKDFIRKRGANKTRDSNINVPKKNIVKRLPLRDRLNDRVKSNSSMTNSTKKAPLKSMQMSKRNEEQMKIYVERQSKGRKYRAEKEKVKMYAHFVRTPVPDALNHL